MLSSLLMCYLQLLQAGNNSAMKLLDVYPWENWGEGAGVRDENESKEAERVGNDNFMTYIRRTLEFCLDKGIRAQMDAFKGGVHSGELGSLDYALNCVTRCQAMREMTCLSRFVFSAGLERVFPMAWLSVFTSAEIGQMVRGSSDVSWTREDLLAYMLPNLGYTKSSPAFLHFVDVLMEFNAEERRKFICFISGSSSLPVGGLTNLRPRLQVVPKDPSEGFYPSVNVCSHFLKLPDFSKVEDLRHYLLISMEQTRFYLT